MIRRRPAPKLSFGPVILATTLVLAACGGGGGALGTSRFASRANQLCRSQAVEAERSFPGFRGRPTSFEQVAATADDAARLATQQTREFRRLGVPQGRERQMQRIYRLQEDRIQVFTDLRDAAVDGDRRGVQSLLAETQKVQQELGDEYRDLGLDQCA